MIGAGKTTIFAPLTERLQHASVTQKRSMEDERLWRLDQTIGERLVEIQAIRMSYIL